MSGVPGGGRTKENSEAREDNGVCFVESAIMRLLLRSRRLTRDWGVMSLAKPGKKRSQIFNDKRKKKLIEQLVRTFCFRGK